MLHEYLGDARLAESLVPVLLPSYEIERREPVFFKSHRATEEPGRDFRIRDAARATSAAPTYFEPARISDTVDYQMRQLLPLGRDDGGRGRDAHRGARQADARRGAAGLLLAPLFGASASHALLAAAAGAAAGWIIPSFTLDSKIKARQKEIQRALPDGLDMLVVCVEAGLGLNQAIVRVSEEVNHLSRVLSEELALVNPEIRAGTPREDALGERTGVDDLRSLTAMLIQTDRFGTSIAQALRVHADTLRTRRCQRAEEAAARPASSCSFRW